MSKQNDTLEIVDRSDKLLTRNLEFIEKVPEQYQVAFSGILISISLLDFLLSFSKNKTCKKRQNLYYNGRNNILITFMEKLYSIKDIVRRRPSLVKERKLRQLIIDGEIEAINISKGLEASKLPIHRASAPELPHFKTRNPIIPMARPR